MLKRLPLLLAAGLGCGGKGGDPPAPAKQDGASAHPTVAPLVVPALGVDRPTRFDYTDGDGEKDYQRAIGAYKKKDWAGVRASCEKALAADPSHLDAHWLLAGALAQTGDLAGAVDHVVTVVAADDVRFGAVLDTPDLAPLMASTYGKPISELATRVAADYARVAGSGLWLVARDAAFHTHAPHGELYVYDREARRYLRISHTDHAVAGFVRAAQSPQFALLGFERVERPKDGPAALIARGWVLVIGSDGKVIGKPAVLPTARQLALGYAAGDQLLVSTAPATGKWTLGDATVQAVDAATGKLAAASAAMPATHIAITVDDGAFARASDDAKAPWAGDTAPALEVNGDTIAIPETGQATRSTVAVSRDKGHVAFATAADPCNASFAPSLYIADTRAKTLRHVLTARSRFDTRWLDDAVVAYEHGSDTIRLFDVQLGREVDKLEDRAGIALDVLSPMAGAPCTSDGAELDGGSAGSAGSAGSSVAPGSAEPMPPEE